MGVFAGTQQMAPQQESRRRERSRSPKVLTDKAIEKRFDGLNNSKEGECYITASVWRQNARLPMDDPRRFKAARPLSPDPHDAELFPKRVWEGALARWRQEWRR